MVRDRELHFHIAPERRCAEPFALRIDTSRCREPCAIYGGKNQHTDVPRQHGECVARVEERWNQKETPCQQQIECTRSQRPRQAAAWLRRRMCRIRSYRELIHRNWLIASVLSGEVQVPRR